MATNLASFKSSEIELEQWTLTRTQWIIEQMASRFHLDSSHFDLSFTPSAQNTINKETSFWPNYTKVFPQSSKAMKTASLWYLYQQITPAHEINKTPSEVTKQGYQVEREQATTDTEGREQPYNPLREARNLPMGSEDPPRTPSPGTLVVAVVVTQLFSYMVDIGVQYGYICTGKAFVFLHIPKDPTVVKYLRIPNQADGELVSTGPPSVKYPSARYVERKASTKWPVAVSLWPTGGKWTDPECHTMFILPIQRF